MGRCHHDRYHVYSPTLSYIRRLEESCKDRICESKLMPRNDGCGCLEAIDGMVEDEDIMDWQIWVGRYIGGVRPTYISAI